MSNETKCTACDGSGLHPNEVPGVGTEWVGCPDCPDKCEWCGQSDDKHENGCRFGLGPDEPDAFDSLPIAALLHARLASWFGDDRQSFLVADLVPVVTQIVAEFQHNAVEMARKADIAEARAEGAVAAIERARDVLDGWEHDGPKGYEFHLLILRVREALDGATRACRRCECGVDGDGQCPCGCDEPNDCDHDWLDRPESDTRECLICGTEVAG